MAASQEIPEAGEFVMTTATRITPHGVYVTLDEYRGTPGFLHISEISTGWVRHIERFAKVGQKMVLKVIRVNPARGELDLSLRQVTGEEKREKILQVKKVKKADVIAQAVRAKAKVSGEEGAKFETLIVGHFGSLYDGLEGVARRGGQALEGLELPAGYAQALEEVAKEKIRLPRVEVRGVLEVYSTAPDGVEVVKRALATCLTLKPEDADVNITYLGAPRYRIAVMAENYKVAEKVLEESTRAVKDRIGKKGSFNFVREGRGRSVE